MLRLIGRLTIAFWIIALSIGIPVGSYAIYLQVVKNIHVVEPGLLYRSATLSADRMQRLIDETGVRTIVTLRGGEGREWFENQREVATRNGVEFVALPLSATEIPSNEDLENLVFLLEQAPRPILVHCKAGADRAGLAAAIFQHAILGKSEDEARGQLSFAYGHFPWFGSQTAAMGYAFDRFVDDWRDAQRKRNAPDEPPAGAEDQGLTVATR